MTVACLKMLMVCVFGVMVQHALSETILADSDSYNNYMKSYNKEYHRKEYEKRFQIWQNNVDLINNHNKEFSMGLSSYTMGLNQFTDMTNDEYRNLMLTYKPNTGTTGASEFPVFSKPLPKSVDWKAEGYVTEVGNQGQCGSCWAYTATGALEGQHKKKTGVLVDLSEQNLMDCSQKLGNQGCEGGFMDYAFKYVKQNGGIDTEQSYPYNLTNPGTYTCRYRKSDSGATCTGYVDLPKGNEKSLQEAVAFIGPISGAVDASHIGFQMYKSGVYDDQHCSSTIVDHSLVVVGYGVENGKEYYNCKNSWGTSWGDQGYIKMVRNKKNQCGIASTASYPTM